MARRAPITRQTVRAVTWKADHGSCLPGSYSNRDLKLVFSPFPPGIPDAASLDTDAPGESRITASDTRNDAECMLRLVILLFLQEQRNSFPLLSVPLS